MSQRHCWVIPLGNSIWVDTLINIPWRTKRLTSPCTDDVSQYESLLTVIIQDICSQPALIQFILLNIFVAKCWSLSFALYFGLGKASWLWILSWNWCAKSPTRGSLESWQNLASTRCMPRKGSRGKFLQRLSFSFRLGGWRDVRARGVETY